VFQGYHIVGIEWPHGKWQQNGARMKGMVPAFRALLTRVSQAQKEAPLLRSFFWFSDNKQVSELWVNGCRLVIPTTKQELLAPVTYHIGFSGNFLCSEF
jgi:hypothetical protein